MDLVGRVQALLALPPLPLARDPGTLPPLPATLACHQLNLLTLSPACQVSPVRKHGSADRRYNRQRALNLAEEKVILGAAAAHCSVGKVGKAGRTRLANQVTFHLNLLTCHHLLGFFPVIDPTGMQNGVYPLQKNILYFSNGSANPRFFIITNFRCASISRTCPGQLVGPLVRH